MYIYKITNIKNNKIYIGQTIQDIKKRFDRHISDSLSNIIDTKLSRAIRKYGKENFIIKIIDTALNKEELNIKETYYINFFDSIKNGYNMTDGAIGGNTYQYKTEEELKSIKDKLHDSKLGKKNPHAVAVKCKNIINNKILHFQTVIECQKYFKENNHNFITKRCNNMTNYLYKKEWIIVYEKDKFCEEKWCTEKNISKKTPIYIIELNENIKKEFSSFTDAEKYYELKKGTITKAKRRNNNNNTFVIKNKYKVILK